MNCQLCKEHEADKELDKFCWRCGLFMFFQKKRNWIIFIWVVIFTTIILFQNSPIVLWVNVVLFGMFMLVYERKKQKETGKILGGIRWYQSHRQIKR